MDRLFYVYIMTNNPRGVLYTGITNNLVRRVHEHRSGQTPSFTRRYNLHRLVYYEWTSDVTEAIRRETQIKGWLRAKKIALIESMNPTWEDLARDWYEI
jgi:putative endonuclease